MVIVQDFESLRKRIANSLRANDALIIGICGLGGAGKTTLCKEIITVFPNEAVHFDCDKFSRHSYRHRETRIAEAIASGDLARIALEENPLHWYAFNDICTALNNLRVMRSHTYKKAWNNKTGELDKEYNITLPSTGPAIVLCDCIFLLHEPVRDWMDHVLHVEASSKVTTERGRHRSNGDTERASYMERLAQTYSLPYFTQYAVNADWVYTQTPDE